MMILVKKLEIKKIFITRHVLGDTLYRLIFFFLFSQLDLTDYVINKKHPRAVYDLHAVSVSLSDLKIVRFQINLNRYPNLIIGTTELLPS